MSKPMSSPPEVISYYMINCMLKFMVNEGYLMRWQCQTDYDVDPRKSYVFTLSFLTLQLITLSAKMDYQGITVIPRLPDEYTSDPHLKSFLTLVITGLNQTPSSRPTL